MYIVNTNDPKNRCFIALNWQTLSSIIRFCTREGIWLDSMWYIYYHARYWMIWEQNGFFYDKELTGKELVKFYQGIVKDGAKLLSVHPLSARAYVNRTHTRNKLIQ